MKNSNLLNRLLSYSHEKQSPQRFGRYAVMLLMLLTLGVGQMWAMDVKKPKVYFNNQTPNWSTSYLYFAVGHDSYTRLYYTTTISNTKLQYVNLGNYDCSYCSCDCQQWSDANYVAFCRTTSDWGQSGSYGYSNISGHAQKYSGKKSSYNMNSGNTYYCYMANANNGATLSVDYKSSGYSDIPKFNATQSAKKRDTGTTYSTVSGSWPATLKLKGTYLSGDGASTQSTITSTASTDGDAKKVYGAVVTGKITHSYESLSSNYYFEGWGTGSTPSSTDATYSYNISAATTVYAFFSKLYTLNFDKKGTYGTSTISASVANYTSISSGNKVPTGHTITFTASPASGYVVEGWYSDAECTPANRLQSRGTTYTISSLDANTTVYCKFVATKNITVYIYVGGCTSDQINSIELFGTPYVGSVALDAVHYYIGDFTIDGNWRKYTFTNVSEVQSLVVARSGGRAVDNITATADVYAKWDGTALDGKCVSAPSLTWTTAPANGTAGEDMTAVVNTTAVSGGSPSITWTSSDDGVATVSNGVITYVAAGTATITAAVSWSATGDYCAGSQNLAQAITVSAAIVPTISAASFTNNPILTWEWVKISFTYANIPDGAYYRIKGGAGYYRDKNNLTNIPISGDGTEDFEAACDQVNMIDNQSWVVEIYNSSNVKIVERTVGNLRVTSQAAELSSITLSPNTTQNYAGSPIDITMSVTSKYVPNPVVIFYVADNSNSTTYEVVATTGAIGSRTNYTTTHTATFSASHAATYSVTAKVFAGKLVDDFESTITTWENVGGGSFSTVANPYQQAKNGSSHVKQITPNGEDWKTALTRTTSAWNNEYQYIHAKMYYQGGTDLRWKINDAPTELVQTIGATSTWQDVAFNNSGRATINFMFPFVKGQTNVFYVDDIILSTEASMTARATQSTAASVTIRDVYDITYLDQGGAPFSGSHVDSPSSHPTTHTYGAATTLNSATKTGYTFGGWFTTSACTGVAVNSLGATAYTDDITLYAKWTENTVTVSPTNHYDAGNPSYLNPTASNSGTVGIVSTSQLVAPTPGTGYTFAGWTLSSNLVVTVGNAATDRTITVRTNGDGNAVSATANYNEVLTTVWYLTGSFNSWSASANKFAKRTGESTGSVAYTTIDLPASTHYEFGVNNGSSYYSNNNGSSETYYIKESVENWTFEKDLGYGVNCHMKTTVAGTYTFKIDFSASNPKISVTYPVSYTLTYAIGSVNGTSGNITTSPTTASGSKVLSGTNVTLTAPAAKTGYSWSGWYTNAAGTEGKITDTNRAITVTMNADKTLYACYTINNHTITHSAASHGDYTIKVGSAAAVNTNTTADYNQTITLAEQHATGYHHTGWSVTKSPSGSVTVTSNQFTMPDADVTVAATFTANTYQVQFHRNGASESTVYQDFTYDVAQNLTANTYTRTGYTFAGWATSASGEVVYADGAEVSNLTDTQGATYHLYAKWNAKTTNITLDQTGAATTGSVTTRTGTYNADMPAISGANTLPVAPQGYAFMGYYDALEPLGNKYYNADGTSARTWNKEDAEATLYAYFKKAEITALEASPGVIAPGETITITPTIEPTPTGTTKVCYELQYSNGTPLPSQPTFAYDGNAVTFPVPSASATYIIQAVLETGSTCGSGTELSRRTTTFQVAGAHDVTVKYMCGDLTIKASEVLGEIRPLTWSDDITAPTITGYTFARWDAGDGVTIKDGSGEDKTTSTSSTIKIKAVYDGTLTAVYNKKKMIFFNNTLGWSDVYVYFYNTNKYWSGDYGSGAMKGQGFGEGESEHPYWEEEHGHMTQIEGTNIWYFDYEGANISTRANVVFTEANQHDSRWFWKTKAARRSDHVASLQMFVPLTTKTETKNSTDYFSSGYWMNYPENTGYSLLIYNQTAKDGATKLYEIPFEFTEDFTMPMELVVDLEAGQTYGFEIKRADGEYYGNTGTMTANTTNWAMEKDRSSYCGLQTTAAGNYTFRLYYSSSNYRMDVTYPVAVNDYRIVYTDLATWSKTAHTASWNHPSRVITKNSSATETKKDTVSFFWSYGSTPAIKYQKCTGTGAGSVTWNIGTEINVSGFSSVLTKKGVYNFIFEQPAGGASISLIKVEPYTGNYYIRTDCAGSTKWANFSTLDHQMTYSEYTETNSGYSHYYTRWVTNGTNVKFCIANDYSQCISDTLAEDYGTVIANINAGGTLNSGNASIRFMWNQATNKISRAYISGSTNISDRFLVLEGDAKMYDENGNSLNITGLNANEINLVDDQNFVYERTIQVNTGAKAKLTATYNNNVQYFKGGSGTTAADSVELLGGNAAGKHSMRIVYDFKTNRLVTAYIPSGTIEDNIAINADLMIVREHQEAGQQLLFNGGSLSKVHTVYGVMRFNRWTLNNKETTGSHDPVGDPKSAYERALYWISFPFNVNLSDVFGFGTYGTHWIIMEYDGAERAQKGYWKDSKGFWKYVTNRNAKVLEAGKGYVLALDLDLMKYDDTSFWSHNIEQVELFFPSASEVNNISETNVQTTVAEHECTIDRRTDKSTPDINKDRTKADSHWNMIGIPSYANYGTTLTDGAGGSTITWNSNPYTNDLPFLYEWNMVDNTYTVQSGTTYPFKSMHAYMVQYHGNLYWSLASATPVSPIVARRTYAEKPQNVELRLELSQNEMKVDQTFVKLSNDENVSTKFAFDEDLCKEYNANKANIYTFIEGYIPAGGNTLPMTEQTMVVPVGVQIAANGDYTFAIPEGTEGIGITLIDNETGIRTSLSALDYTINLNAGTYNERFLLEISPVHQSPTAIELLNGENGENGVRKVLIDNILYIVKDGVMYDARGSRVQ